MNKLLLLCLATATIIFACKKAEVVEETTKQTVEKTDVNASFRTNMFYLHIPSEYEADPEDEVTLLTETVTTLHQGNTYTVVIEAEVTNGGIVSISCSDSWANKINLPDDCVLTEQDLADELDSIMNDAAEEGFRAPKWWTKFKRWVRRVFVGCTGTELYYAQGCKSRGVQKHWLTTGGNTVPNGQGSSASTGCENGVGITWNAPCD